MPASQAFGASDGKELYTKNCKECHGVTGDGKGASGKMLSPKVKQDLSDPATQAKLKDDDIVKSITDGVTQDGKELMKPLKAKKNLSDDDIKALVEYVRSLKK
jgi:mono/diheme cytochrome c family protein